MWGRIVQTLKYATDETLQLSQGTIGVYQDIPGMTADDPTIHMLEHNAMISSSEFGMPLFNECGQVVAMNTPEPDAGHWLTGWITEPEGKVLALRSNDIIAVLKDEEITHTPLSRMFCLSAIERAQRTAMQQQKAAETAAAAKQEAEEAQQQAEAAKAAAETAKAAAEEDAALKKQEAETAEAARLAAEETSRLKQEEAERLQQEQTKKEQQLQWAVVTGTILILLALLGWAIYARSKRKKLQVADARLSTAEQEGRRSQTSSRQGAETSAFQMHIGRSGRYRQTVYVKYPGIGVRRPCRRSPWKKSRRFGIHY